MSKEKIVIDFSVKNFRIGYEKMRKLYILTTSFQTFTAK